MSKRLLMIDSEGEPWLDNPHLLIANPRKTSRLPDLSGLFSHFTARQKGRKKMAKRRRKMTALQRKYFGKGHKANPTMFAGRLPKKFKRKLKHRRSYRGRLVAAGTSARVKFRTNRRHHRKANYYFNPRHSAAQSGAISLPFGLQAPAVKDIAFGALGLIVPGMITSRVVNMLPVSVQGTAATWFVKIVSVLVPGMALKRFVDSRAGYAYMIGGAASLLIDAIRTFVPSVSSMIGLGFQPLLGYYPGGQVVGMGDYSVNTPKPMLRSVPMKQSAITSGTPSRLDPANRF